MTMITRPQQWPMTNDQWHYDSMTNDFNDQWPMTNDQWRLTTMTNDSPRTTATPRDHDQWPTWPMRLTTTTNDQWPMTNDQWRNDQWPMTNDQWPRLHDFMTHDFRLHMTSWSASWLHDFMAPSWLMTSWLWLMHLRDRATHDSTLSGRPMTNDQWLNDSMTQWPMTNDQWPMTQWPMTSLLNDYDYDKVMISRLMVMTNQRYDSRFTTDIYDSLTHYLSLCFLPTLHLVVISCY
jgi:hypothetical protein